MRAASILNAFIASPSNAKCKMQNAKSQASNFAFCILHFAFLQYPRRAAMARIGDGGDLSVDDLDGVNVADRIALFDRMPHRQQSVDGFFRR